MKKAFNLILFLITPLVLLAQQKSGVVELKDIFLRDACILPDKGIYYMVGPGRNASVVQYTSKDLIHWQGPEVIFNTPLDFWGDIPIESIWAPELQTYQGKYYLFLTFSTKKELPEQWLNWRPRVVRGSQILVGDSPQGPFKAFANHATTPSNLMTLDGTLYVEDGKPYMVYAHEWVQVSNGTIEYIPLKDDLSEAIGNPALLFRANEASWVVVASRPEGCYVTDAPYFLKSKSGKLFMIWSSFSAGGYTVGVAVSESAKLAGPWMQQPIPLFDQDGGHGMIFKTFDGKLIMILHAPNNRQAQPHLFEIEDTGSTIQIVRELKQ